MVKHNFLNILDVDNYTAINRHTLFNYAEELFRHIWTASILLMKDTERYGTRHSTILADTDA